MLQANRGSPILRVFRHIMLKLAFYAVLACLGYWAYSAFVAPKPRAPRLAPEGTFFLREYASVRTAHGITGLAAGEIVRQVGDAGQGSMIKVTNGDVTFDVSVAALTNDLDLAESLQRSDLEAQRALRENADLAQSQAQRAAGLTDASRAADAATYEARLRRGGAIGSASNALTAGPRGVIVSTAAAPGYYGGVIMTTTPPQPYQTPTKWSPPK